MLDKTPIEARIALMNPHKVNPTDYLDISEICFEEGFADAGVIALNAYRASSRGYATVSLIRASLASDSEVPKEAKKRVHRPKADLPSDSENQAQKETETEIKKA